MLAKLQNMRDEREQGFTLIELLIVILIIGILAAIAIPAFLNQRKAAVDSSAQSDAKNAATAIETWLTSNPQKAVPSFQVDEKSVVTALGAVAVTDDAKNIGGTIKVSNGNTIEVTGGTKATDPYTIVVSNPNGNKSVKEKDGKDGKVGIKYISNEGGLKG